ncbi:MAG TPA: Rrf2 family transcriptional regulator [Planctomycetota bacterium]|nr:Rrf2 family transcriptional regulator [Planctomycetota bacterium]
MKELSASTVLALHALHLMVRKAKPISADEIRRAGGTAMSRVKRVLKNLKNAELVESRRGQGYVLARAPGEISLEDVVHAQGETQAPKAPCGGDFEACASRATCILAPLCRTAEQNFQEALRSFTLADFEDLPTSLPNCIDLRLKHSGRLEAS